MKRISFLAACTTLLLVLAGCGGGNVDEALLPTRIPTLSPGDLVVTSANVEPVPTATSEPAPTAEPATAEAPADAPQVEPTTQDDVATPEAETAPQETVTSEETPPSEEVPAVEESPTAEEVPTGAETTSSEEEVAADTVADPTEEMTDIVTAVGPTAAADDDADGAISASEEVTGTGAVQLDAVSPANGQEITSTLELTVTEAGDNQAGAAVTEEMTDTTSTGASLPTPMPDATSDEPPEADEVDDGTTPGSETITPEPGAEVESNTADDVEDAGPIDLNLPENIAQALADADVDNGEALILSNACIGCHSLDPDQPMPGPTWSNLAITAATRVEGQDAAAYLYHSIVNPNQYLVEGFQPNVMLQIYRDTLSDQAMADIIAYLLTLEGRN